MLTVDEIKMFIDEDAASVKKHFARIGERYYDGDHDIKNYRMFYFNQDGQLVEDTSRANVRIPHPFFKELTEQGTQYTLSGSDGFVFSDDPALQSELDSRFNNNDDFVDELSEAITDCQTKGFAYMYAMKDSKDQLKFICADSIGVVEVEARFAEDRKDHVIYWYVDRVDKEGHRIKKIMDWDDEQVVYYVQDENGEIEKDTLVKVNPRPHVKYVSKENITEADYLENVAYVGTLSSGKNVIIILPNALCTEAFELETKNAEQTTFAVKFECTADLENDSLNKLDIAIYYPNAVV